MTWDRGSKGRTDGALVRVTLPVAKDRAPDDDFFELASLFAPVLPEYVPN